MCYNLKKKKIRRQRVKDHFTIITWRCTLWVHPDSTCNHQFDCVEKYGWANHVSLQYHGTVKTQQQQAALITAFSAQLVLLYTTALLHAENVKQLFGTNVCSLMMDQKGPKHVFCDIIVILIKPSAIVDSNCNNWIIMHGTHNVIECIVTTSFGVLSCTVVVLTCFVTCGCVYVGVFWRMCACYGNTCTCIYCIFYSLYCVLYCFVYVYLFLLVLSVLI